MNRNTHILLVEDNDDDVFAFQRALKKAQISDPMQVVTDGRQALDYLGGSGAYADRSKHPVPAVVFLDLKLPYHDGFEVLGWIRQQAALRDLPVVILTGSDETRDHQRGDALGARFYLVKPPSPEDLRRVLGALLPSPVAAAAPS
jgi:CheY-like chemotaxis protein